MADEHLISTNGGAPALKPLVITLTLTPTPLGYAMRVEHDPTIFPDTVIEACQRAVRIYEQLALIRQMQSATTQVQPVSEAELRRIQGRLMS